MIKEEIDKLISFGEFPEATIHRKLVETHISWVILCDEFVYKIKKPIQYSFLDFSTLSLRKYFCEREIELNQRFSTDIYLNVVPVYELNGNFIIGGEQRTPIEYAVKMRKLDPEKQMDILISQNKVSDHDIKSLAERIADFHKSTTIIYDKNVLDVMEKFRDLAESKDFISQHLGENYGERIDHAIQVSDAFLQSNEELLQNRLKEGYFRDCHGDLHTRNIFLLPEPQLFDCIEFNDDYREIDVLNEVAFLCMDLDALDKKNLSDFCIAEYNRLFPVMNTEVSQQLFVYYKCYRANIRAKVNSLRAKSDLEQGINTTALTEVKNYLSLMDRYLKLLDAIK